MSRSGFFTLFLLVAFLTGCATRPPAQKLPESNASIDAFSLVGKVAVKIDNRGYTANLRWRHVAARDVLRLLSPVGSVVGEIETDESGATLTTGDKKVYKSSDPQALTRDVLGWDIPLSGLRYWVTGRPDPGAAVQSQERDDKQRLVALTQSDWKITYLEYFGDSALPARMSLVYEKLSLRLVVQQWDLEQ